VPGCAGLDWTGLDCVGLDWAAADVAAGGGGAS